jgi:UDP-N-acetylmuramoylalanine--D-glutamate ligase
VTTGLNLWFAAHRPDNVIAITGTKGKSTTATVVAHLLRRAGHDVLLAGNIGVPVLDLDRSPDDVDEIVLELSSYQLADLDAELAVGVLLNLHPEHVDWHGTHDQYADDKCRIIDLSRVLVSNGDDREVAARSAGHPEPRWFSVAEREVRAGALTIPRDELHAALARSPLTGLHQQWNVAAALTAVAEVGVSPTDALGWLDDVVALPHRLQVVADDGRRWVDDSISTIPEAAVAALRAFPDEPVTLLAGGYDRQQDHAVLVAAASRHGDVRVITMPDTGLRLAGDLRAGAPDVEVHEVGDLAAAVRLAADITPVGGVVLLSPAAPSYGHFTSFEDRGDQFAALAGVHGSPA